MEPKSQVDPEGAPNTKGRGQIPKQSSKEGAAVGPTVFRVAAGKLQPPVVQKSSANLSEMVIPAMNWPKHQTPP